MIAGEQFADIRLSTIRELVLAEASVVARFGEVKSPLRSEQITETRRRENTGGNIWNTLTPLRSILPGAGDRPVKSIARLWIPRAPLLVVRRAHGRFGHVHESPSRRFRARDPSAGHMAARGC